MYLCSASDTDLVSLVRFHKFWFLVLETVLAQGWSLFFLYKYIFSKILLNFAQIINS